MLAAALLLWRAPAQAPRRPAANPAAPAPMRPATPTTDPGLTAARAALSRREYARVLLLCAQAEKQGAPVAAVEAVRAAAFRETDYLDREIEACQRWAAAAPQDPAPWLKLFYIYDRLRWKREADRASARAVQLAPEDPRSHVARARFHDRYTNAALAMQEADAAQRRDPTNPALANLRASLLLRGGRARDAEAEIRKALAREPGYAGHHLVLVEALLRQGRIEEAVGRLREVQRRDPRNVAAAYALGLLAERRGDLAEAAAQMERAAAGNARHESVLWRLAALRRRQGRVREGEKLAKLYATMQNNTNDFEAALEQLGALPGDLNLHYRLARMYLAAEDLPLAIVELRAVLQFSPKHPRVRRDLVAALRRAGRLTEARRLAASGTL